MSQWVVAVPVPSQMFSSGNRKVRSTRTNHAGSMPYWSNHQVERSNRFPGNFFGQFSQITAKLMPLKVQMSKFTYRSLVWHGYGIACTCISGSEVSVPACTETIALSIMSCSGMKMWLYLNPSAGRFCGWNFHIGFLIKSVLMLNRTLVQTVYEMCGGK